MSRKLLGVDSRYEDMLDLPHHVSLTHPQMLLGDRAAQFAPFAALTGHEAAIRETARITGGRKELDENAKARLDQKLEILKKQGGEVSLLYFQPDEKKEGGTYVTAAGNVKRIDTNRRVLVMGDGAEISVDEIAEMEGTVFDSMGEGDYTESDGRERGFFWEDDGWN